MVKQQAIVVSLMNKDNIDKLNRLLELGCEVVNTATESVSVACESHALRGRILIILNIYDNVSETDDEVKLILNSLKN